MDVSRYFDCPLFITIVFLWFIIYPVGCIQQSADFNEYAIFMFVLFVKLLSGQIFV